jgi:hypothetical protein
MHQAAGMALGLHEAPTSHGAAHQAYMNFSSLFANLWSLVWVPGTYSR